MSSAFRFLTAGESHGKGLVAIIEGMVAGLPLTEADIDLDLKRRQHGYGRGMRMRIEQDSAEILSGVRHGLTLGSPISLIIRNRDWENWQEVMNLAPVEQEVERVTRLRPGHADFVGVLKYGFDDVRPVLERASARETAARVAVGSIARRLVRELDITIHSHTVAVGGVRADVPESVDWVMVERSPVRCVDADAGKRMVSAIEDARSIGDTLGGIFEIIAEGVPVGLGSHVHWDRKLSGRIAQAVMSINAVKGVEIGEGFDLTKIRGSEAHDVIKPSEEGGVWCHITNHAGGVEGGMSNGEPIVIRAAVKPIATLGNPLPSVDLESGEETEAHYERSDVCAVPSAGVIGEAMLAIVLADAVLEKFGGDSLKETMHNYREYMNTVGFASRDE